MNAQLRIVEEKGFEEFDLAEVTPERLEGGRKISVIAIAKTWGLANHRQTPDFDAFLELLNARFGNATDDIPHEDLFLWNES